MPSIYITDLPAYNEGFLVGKWIKLPLSSFELSQAISEVLSEGEAISGSDNHEEHFITDYEWDSHELYDISEYEDIHKLNEQLQLLEFKSEQELKAIAFLLQNQLATDIEDAISKVEDVVIYENQTMQDVAYDLMQECYQADLLPSIIANNIDYDAIGKDLELDGTYYYNGADVYQYQG